MGVCWACGEPGHFADRCLRAQGNNWESVLQEDDIDKADENFLNIFKLLYDKNCPLKMFFHKNKYSMKHEGIAKCL